MTRQEDACWCWLLTGTEQGTPPPSRHCAWLPTHTNLPHLCTTTHTLPLSLPLCARRTLVVSRPLVRLCMVMMCRTCLVHCTPPTCAQHNPLRSCWGWTGRPRSQCQVRGVTRVLGGGPVLVKEGVEPLQVSLPTTTPAHPSLCHRTVSFLSLTSLSLLAADTWQVTTCFCCPPDAT
jgi:hypothetical protein